MENFNDFLSTKSGMTAGATEMLGEALISTGVDSSRKNLKDKNRLKKQQSLTPEVCGKITLAAAKILEENGYSVCMPAMVQTTYGNYAPCYKEKHCGSKFCPFTE